MGIHPVFRGKRVRVGSFLGWTDCFGNSSQEALFRVGFVSWIVCFFRGDAHLLLFFASDNPVVVCFSCPGYLLASQNKQKKLITQIRLFRALVLSLGEGSRDLHVLHIILDFTTN